MARITIEDCTRMVPNRFHLVQMAAIRTKQLKKGASALVESDGNKEVVMSLREIAEGHVMPDEHQGHTMPDAHQGHAMPEAP